jgi:type IV pilus assembly protein PilO
MHQAIENILERPTSHKIGIWIATILLILAGFWQFSLSSLIEEREKLDEEVARLDSEILTEKRLAGKLGKAEEKLKDLEARLKGALEQLPDKSEIDNLLEKISNLARESGLDLNLFQRKEENFKDFYAEVPVSVSVTGSYHQVATFFDEVSRLPRIVNINQIEIIDPKPNESSVIVKVSCVLTAFRYLSDKERADQAGQGDKKKRR